MDYTYTFLKAKRIIATGKFPLVEYSVENRKDCEHYHNGGIRPIYICAVMDGVMMAVMGLEIVPKGLFISPLEVRPEYRHNHVGTKIVIRLLNASIPMLVCYCDDGLVGFWERLGFQQKGMTKYGEHRMVRTQPQEDA